jgi:hypothetical protein
MSKLEMRADSAKERLAIGSSLLAHRKLEGLVLTGQEVCGGLLGFFLSAIWAKSIVTYPNMDSSMMCLEETVIGD